MGFAVVVAIITEGRPRRSFEAVMRGLEWEAEEEPAFATIPTVSA